MSISRTLIIITGLTVIAAAATWQKQTVKIISDYFSGITQPINLAIYRIILFVTIFVSAYTNNVILFSKLPGELMVLPRGLWWFPRMLPINEKWAMMGLTMLLICCATAALGIFGRVSALLVVCLGFYVLGIPQLYGKINHYHHLLWFASILVVSPAWDVFSVDAIYKSWQRADAGHIDPSAPSVKYALPFRFIWLLMGVIYFFPGFWKVWTVGSEWVLSDNIKYLMYHKWFELTGWMPLARIDQFPWLYRISAVATLIFEMSFILLVIPAITRPLIALGGLGFHNMTYQFMGISFWELQTSYASFFNWHHLLMSVGRWLFPQDMYLLYDGNCKLCRRTIASIRVFDVFERTRYINLMSEAERSSHNLMWLDELTLYQDMHVVVGRKKWAGIEAYRALSWRVPVLWPVLPFLYFPPVKKLGDYFYRKVANSRTCNVVRDTAAVSNNPSWVRTHTYASLPIVTVGLTLFLWNVIFGFAKISTWPAATYPTFDWVVGEQTTTIYIEAQTLHGKVST